MDENSKDLSFQILLYQDPTDDVVSQHLVINFSCISYIYSVRIKYLLFHLLTNVHTPRKRCLLFQIQVRLHSCRHIKCFYLCLFSVFCKFLCLTDETNLSRVVWIIIVGFTTTSQRCIVYHSMYNLNINSCRRLTDLSLQLARYLIHAWIVSVNCFKFPSDEVFQRVSRRSRFLSISSNSDWW